MRKGLCRRRRVTAPPALQPADAFGKSPLFIGGPVTKNLLHVLHGRRDVEGCLEIMDVSAAALTPLALRCAALGRGGEWKQAAGEATAGGAPGGISSLWRLTSACAGRGRAQHRFLKRARARIPAAAACDTNQLPGKGRPVASL